MTTASKLKKMSYNDLLTLRRAVDDAILRRHSEERQELTEKLTQLADVFGIKVGGAKMKSVKPASAKPAKAKRVSANKGKKVKPKYRNPARPQETWTGRGRQPRWLAHEVAQGKKLESFLIN